MCREPVPTMFRNFGRSSARDMFRESVPHVHELLNGCAGYVHGMCQLCAKHTPLSTHMIVHDQQTSPGTCRCAEYVLDAVIRALFLLCAKTSRINFGTYLEHTPAKLETTIYIHTYR